MKIIKCKIFNYSDTIIVKWFIGSEELAENWKSNLIYFYESDNKCYFDEYTKEEILELTLDELKGMTVKDFLKLL